MKNFKRDFIHIYGNLEIKDSSYSNHNIIKILKKRIKNTKFPNNHYSLTIGIYNDMMFDDDEDIRENSNRKIDRLGRTILDKREKNEWGWELCRNLVNRRIEEGYKSNWLYRKVNYILKGKIDDKTTKVCKK